MKAREYRSKCDAGLTLLEGRDEDGELLWIGDKRQWAFSEQLEMFEYE